jgi:hypothetical protein
VVTPADPPVTGTFTVVAVGANNTVAGTVAMVESVEVTLIVNPVAGAGEERVSTRFFVSP